MVETAEDLQAWFASQPPGVCVAIAARAALRVLPRAFRLTRRETAGILYDDPLEAHFRAGLTACVAAVLPTHDVKLAAKASTSLEPNLLVAQDPVFRAALVAALAPQSSAIQKGVETVSRAVVVAADNYPFLDLPFIDRSLLADPEITRRVYENSVAFDRIGGGDAQAITSRPLWQNPPVQDGLWQMWEVFRDETGPDSPWAFWKTWYQGFLDGTPLDWGLQMQIALIPSEDWQRGSRHIALIIKDLQARHEVRARAEDVRALLADALAPRHGIGHNQPPEPMDDEPLTAAEQLVTQAIIARVLDEVSQPVPDKAVVSRAMTQIRVVAGKIAAWCAKKADVAIDAGVKAFGVAAGGYALGRLIELGNGLSTLAEAISKWLHFLH